MAGKIVVRIAVCFLALMFLLTGFSFGEKVSWDCLECGTKGNTGDFCEGCGNPPPDTEAEEGSLSEYSAGDHVIFGHYEQDNDPDNGKEPIEWIVLDVQEGKMLLLSRYLLDVKPFHPSINDSVWEKSEIRGWLNQEFLDSAFSEEEQTAIMMTDVDNSPSQGYVGYKGNGEKNTQDQIFLLSYHEVFEQYISEKNARVCSPTEYAAAQGAHLAYSAYKKDEKAKGIWWLRSPGSTQIDTLGVDGTGSCQDVYSRFNGVAVRPAFWLNPESGIHPSAADTKGGKGSAREYSVGDHITFGHYEQDNNSDNGREPIEWIVLDVQEGKILLISRYLLDEKGYNTSDEDVTWQTCTLRKWLNQDFLYHAFSKAERSAILTTNVDNDNSQGYSQYYKTTSGNGTRDKIFLLSYQEAFDTYFSDDKARMSAPTDYALSSGTFFNDRSMVDGRVSGAWWLRSPGYAQFDAAVTLYNGACDSPGVTTKACYVRPVFWMDTEVEIRNTAADQEPEEVSAPKYAVGDQVVFGHYEQDNDLSNGPEPIEWIVLEAEEGKVLLLSRFLLDAKPYHISLEDVTWETCSLRGWLNQEFLNSAFSEEERSAILTATLDNGPKQGYRISKTDGGNNTQDQIFLLSYYEACELYFSDFEDRCCIPTEYQIAQGRYRSNPDETNAMEGCWWLRSPGFSSQDSASIVRKNGFDFMARVNTDSIAVRPAFWLDLGSGM